nr:DUF960 domain-containing protein [Secundilactobacillus kimchicus]
MLRSRNFESGAVKIFDQNRQRYASYGVVNSLPGEMIDQVWFIINNDLQGVFPLAKTLTFKLVNDNNRVRYNYYENESLVASFDTPFPYSSEIPEDVWAYDDGESQLILLPAESMQ